MWKRKLIKKIIITLTVLIVLTVGIYLWIDYKIKPTMNAIAEVRVRYYAVPIMNQAIKEVVSNEENLGGIVTVKTDAEGNIQMIETDSVAMNRLSTRVSERAQTLMQGLTDIKIGIPLGSIISNGILSGKGPNINITMLPTGSVNTGFATEFENAGINQTRHRVYLTLTAYVMIVAPLSGSGITVETRVPITEMIIVGNVPDTYINIPTIDNALDLVQLE